jgi:hypothetical protein
MEKQFEYKREEMHFKRTWACLLIEFLEKSCFFKLDIIYYILFEEFSVELMKPSATI